MTEYVLVKWNNHNKEHYTSKGYEFTKRGYEFLVKPEDVSHGSHVRVVVKCDYCGEAFEVTYCNLMKSYELYPKVACKKCRGKKTVDCDIQKYGCHHTQLEEVKQKAVETNLEKYGVEYHTQDPIVKEKIKHTVKERYGVDNPAQNKDVKARIRETVHEKYGVDVITCSEHFKKKAAETCIEKYGAWHYLKSPVFKNNYKPENHPNYKGGYAAIHDKRGSWEYVQWRNDVYERDDWTCQCCGKRGSTVLAAHHKNSYHYFPEQALDLNNGVTLCVDCHMKFHSEYGFHKNTEEQYIDFINIYGKNVC